MLHRLLVPLLVLVPVAALAQTKAAGPSIVGVWRITSVVTTGANAVTNTKPQPSLVIYTRGYYSIISVNSDAPRPNVAAPKDPDKPTDAELRAVYAMWNPLTANSGTYQLSGATLTRRPTVAKNQAVMSTNPPIVSQIKIEGNKLTVVTKAAAGQPASETTTTLIRVE